MERGGRRSRRARPRRSNNRRRDWGFTQHEDGLNDNDEGIRQKSYGIRERTRSLSSPRESSRRVFSNHDNLTELGKKEKPPIYDELNQASRHEFRVERDDETKRWENGQNRDNLIQPSLEMRINVSRDFENPNELRRAHTERQGLSPSYGEEDGHHHHLFSGNTVIGTLPELFDHRKDKDFQPAVDNHKYGMLLKKSILLEDGTVQTFFTLPPNTSETLHKPKSYYTHDIIDRKTGEQYPIANVDFVSPDSVAAWCGEGPRYIETSNTHNFCYSGLSHEEVLERRESNLSGSIMCPNRLPQSKSSMLDCEVSRLPRGFSFDGHTNSLHAWQEDFPNGNLYDASTSGKETYREDFPNGNLYDASTSDKERYRDMYSKENASVDPIGSLSTKDLGPYSRRQMDGTTKSSMVGSYTENLKTVSSGTTLIPPERYNNRQHGPCHGCCVGSTPREESWQAHETDWMDNTSNLKNHLKGLEKDNVSQNFPVDEYRNMRNLLSLRAISSDLHAESFGSRTGHLSPISRMEISSDIPKRRAPEEYLFGKDVSIVKCRETARNSPLDGAVSLLRSNVSQLSIPRSPIRELDVHGSDIQGLKSKYIHEDDDHRHGLKFQEMDFGENQQEYQVGMSRYCKHSERSFHGKSFHRDSHSRSVSVNKSLDLLDHTTESKPQANLTHSLEWTRSNWHHDDDYFYEKEEQDFCHPHKSQKRENEYDGQDSSRSRYHERDHLFDDRDPAKQPDFCRPHKSRKRQNEYDGQDSLRSRYHERDHLLDNRDPAKQPDFCHSHKSRKRENEYDGQDSSRSRYHERDHLLDDKDPAKQPDFCHPHKSRKRENEYNGQDSSRSRCHERGHLLDDMDPAKQPDLPEDSEAFKQQVQRAFLRFAKVLIENLAERKRYEAMGKSGSILCIVCGRISKDYVDTHSLVMHAFNSKKVGLRAEHLGLHKALCVLMSWNYSLVPGKKAYQSLPASDARAMKEDLILWPPLVIIHIPRFEKKKDGSQDAISNLEMNDILTGLGFSGGKSNAVGHSGGNQDTFIVKFFPTFSGLQVAERLHMHCKENHCGRDEWLQVQSLHRSQKDVGKDTNLVQVEGNAENRGVFYGYIGIAADLEEVDPDTKRRSLVKSRKDIAAIADAPVLIA